MQLAQKLEAVGQLAAGIAHEINTPMQYIGDSVYFLQGAFDDLRIAYERFQECVPIIRAAGGHEALLTAIEEAQEASDIAYLEAHVPRAFERTLEGIERVSSIVQAMREFAHPDQAEAMPADINRALQTALTVSRNEYKYVADIETEFGDLPPVICRLSEINQVLLNLIVNAAHAVEDVVRDTGERGVIGIRTEPHEGGVRISISDTGGGIPEDVQERVFEPFFTTKPVGKGTGQGLAIARAIVRKHGGRLWLHSRVGEGTTFYIELSGHTAGTPPEELA